MSSPALFIVSMRVDPVDRGPMLSLRVNGSYVGHTLESETSRHLADILSDDASRVRIEVDVRADNVGLYITGEITAEDIAQAIAQEVEKP